MSELTLTIIRLGLLVLLWVFVFSVVGVLRGDIYGTRVVSRTPRKPAPSRASRSRPARRRARRPRDRPSGRRTPPTPGTSSSPRAPLTGTSLPLREAGTVIGRNPECALVLDDDFASGRHARIFHRDNAWFVEDLGSTNGTFVGTERLTGPDPGRGGQHAAHRQDRHRAAAIGSHDDALRLPLRRALRRRDGPFGEPGLRLRRTPPAGDGRRHGRPRRR